MIRSAILAVMIAKTAQALACDERKEATDFLQWYQDEHINKENEPVYHDRLVKFAALAHAVLNLQ